MARRAEVTPLEHERSAGELLRAVAGDTGELIRKELELAKLELKESMATMMRAFAGIVASALFGVVALGFFMLAMRDGLRGPLPDWLASLATALTALVIAGLAATTLKAVGGRSLAPQETKRTLKEDVEWAKRQLKR